MKNDLEQRLSKLPTEELKKDISDSSWELIDDLLRRMYMAGEIEGWKNGFKEAQNNEI